MENTKKILGLLLVAVFLIVCSGVGTVHANTDDNTAANVLCELDLFKGTENGFDLERQPTRVEAAVMMVRLLGEEQKVMNGNFVHPFTDVPGWADKHVGFMYENGLTKGTGQDSFGSDILISEKDYATFILRVLGYSDAEGDFSWNTALEFSDSIGLSIRGDSVFTRGSMVDLSYRALDQCLKGTDTKLINKIIPASATQSSDIKEHEENGSYIYYFNMTSDWDYFDDPDSYKIFKIKDDVKEKVSDGKAFAFTIMDDIIYYMKIDYLEREDGFVQRGNLWQVGTDGTNEKQVIEDTIFTVTSDDKYLYFTGDAFENNIMRMEPGKEPKIFQENCKSFRLYYSDGWLYYQDAIDDNIIKRISTDTKKVEIATKNSTNYYTGFLFLVHKNFIIMGAIDYSTWECSSICINIETREGKLIEPGQYISVSNDGTLTKWNREEDAIEFVKLDDIN